MQVIDQQAALTFAEENTSHIETEVNETVYPDIQYHNIVPVDTSAPDFARTVTFYSSDKYGKAHWINGNGDDIPMAGTEKAKHESSIYMAGIGYSWGYEEINQAMLLGHNLPSDDALAARRAYEEFTDQVVLLGDTSKGMEGFIDHSSVTASAAANGSWSAITAAGADAILKDVNDAITSIHSATLTTSMADTICLPHDRLNHLASVRIGDTTMTVLEFLRKNNVYTATTGRPLEIRAIRGLETAGVGDTGRMIAYRKSPQVLKFHMPMAHRFLPVHIPSPLRFEVPGVFRMGGLDVRREKEIRYFDGI